jgi:hypothetical protein
MRKEKKNINNIPELTNSVSFVVTVGITSDGAGSLYKTVAI